MFVYLRTMFSPTRRLLAVLLVRVLALECFRIEEMGAKFLRWVRMSLLAAWGTCKRSVVARTRRFPLFQSFGAAKYHLKNSNIEMK